MPALHVTLIQSRLHWENKEANLRMFEEKIRRIGQPAEIVLLPEMFSTGFSMQPEQLAEKMDGPSFQWMKRVAAENRVILAGSLMIEEEDESGRRLYFNRLLWVLPNGEYGYYDKRHLFAYGGEDRHYHPGSRRLIASVKGWKINLQICYDLRFPVWARQGNSPHGEPEFDLLVYVANWPERRNLAWKTLLQARAIENQCYVIGLNRVGEDGHGIYHSGDSMCVDPLGEVLYSCAHEEDIRTLTLESEKLTDSRNRFPFLADRDQFYIEP